MGRRPRIASSLEHQRTAGFVRYADVSRLSESITIPRRSTLEVETTAVTSNFDLFTPRAGSDEDWTIAFIGGDGMAFS